MKPERPWPRASDEQLNQMRRHDDWRDARYLFWRRFLFYIGVAIILAISYIAYYIQ